MAVEIGAARIAELRLDADRQTLSGERDGNADSAKGRCERCDRPGGGCAWPLERHGTNEGGGREEEGPEDAAADGCPRGEAGRSCGGGLNCDEEVGYGERRQSAQEGQIGCRSATQEAPEEQERRQKRDQNCGGLHGDME